MRVGILGAGFGLYGYLPALLACPGTTILLPLRYREIMQARHDIRSFLPEVHWADDEQVVLEKAQALVICRRPVDQARIVAKLGAYPRITRVLLEKPVACSPDAAAATLHGLAMSGHHVRIGYTFRLTPWAQRLAALLRRGGSGRSLQLRWNFRAHHYAADLHNWKRVVSCGGGAIRFYGIHLIALLADLGYRDVRHSRTRASVEGEAMTWEAVLVGEGLPACDIRIATDVDETGFFVTGPALGSASIDLRDPFSELRAGGTLDPRVDVLTDLCGELLSRNDSLASSYQQALLLWRRIEEKNDTRVALAAAERARSQSVDIRPRRGAGSMK